MIKIGRNEQEINMQPLQHDRSTAPAGRPGLLAPDTSGMNFYRADPALTDLLRLHLPEPLFRHIEPHLDRLGGLAGGHREALFDGDVVARLEGQVVVLTSDQLLS